MKGVHLNTKVFINFIVGVTKRKNVFDHILRLFDFAVLHLDQRINFPNFHFLINQVIFLNVIQKIWF